MTVSAKILTIPLHDGTAALVSEQDYATLSQYRWYRLRNGGYAVRHVRKPDGKRGTVFMHKMIIEPPPGLVVDHADGNPLNNTRENLRVCRQRENLANRRKTTKRANPDSKYKGVNKVIGKNGQVYWRASCAHHHVAHAATEEEAARIYDRKAWELWGEFARLNFPQVDPSTYPPIKCQLHRYYGSQKCFRCGYPAPPSYKPRNPIYRKAGDK